MAGKRICVLSANLGAYDQPTIWPSLDAPAGSTVEVHRFTDENFPPRPLAMTSRLQCGIPKWYGWQMRPGYQVYMWCDASCVPTPAFVTWFLDKLGQNEIAVFRHPDRRTIREEYEFMAERMARPGERYLTSRYKGELLREQYEYIRNDDSYVDGWLLASTAFMYRPTARVTEAFRAIFSAKARWLLHDQLYFPYALTKAGCHVRVIEDSYLRCEAMTYVRNKRKQSAA